MATVGELDFRSYIRTKGASYATEKEGRDDAHAYAYTSDRYTRSAFGHVKAVQLAVEHAVRLLKHVGRNELLGTAVKVGPKQFPRVFDLTKQCADTLGIAVPTVYIRNNPTMNAGTYGTNDDSFILVHSSMIDHFSDEELASVLGHECGHIHNNHVVYLTAMHFLRTMATTVVRWAMAPALVALNSWSRRAEITCDRAGLLCSRDLEVSTRALAKLALGSSKLYEQLNLEAFLEQYDEGQEGIGRYREMTASHPWLPKRVKALRAFATSELYRTHIGEQGGVAMDDVDTEVHEIIKVLN
ncbi:M48 family metallopeptidase [Desulfobulbus sp. AH-315-M07]|nr:M48 family metallopeptidase [Desulfobulbus sp. AH-315-M07]